MRKINQFTVTGKLEGNLDKGLEKKCNTSENHSLWGGHTFSFVFCVIAESAIGGGFSHLGSEGKSLNNCVTVKVTPPQFLGWGAF